jgi:Protein of unknown function (DUF2815)
MALGQNEIRLEDVRLAFPKLWTPEPFPGGNDPTPYFSAMFILPKNHPQAKLLDKMMLDLAIAKWGPAKGPQTLKAAKAIGKVFYRDGDAKADMDGFEGNMFISARSKTRPNTFDGQRNTVSEADGVIYSGCYVNAIISCYAYTKGNNGLGAGLKGVQFKRNGDAFAGGGTPADADDFDEISVEDSDLTA